MARSLPSFLLLLLESQITFAARPERYRRAVGAGAGMAEESADFVRGFGRENVLELAGLLLNFGFAVERQAVGEEAFGEAVSSDNVGGPQDGHAA